MESKLDKDRGFLREKKSSENGDLQGDALLGLLKNRWRKLSDEDLRQINGKIDDLADKLQCRYHWSKAKSHREINSFVSTISAQLASNASPFGHGTA